MQFTCGTRVIDARIDHLYVAGWTGRDRAAVQHHIDELADLGIAPPSTVPLFYRGSKNLITQDELIEVVGTTSSGEVEPLILHHDGELFIGLASDHTDRELEAHSIAAAKQACMKPAAKIVWQFDEVKDHLDDLILTCRIFENGDWIVYQQGPMSTIRPLDTMIQAVKLPENAAMLCGTLGAIGGVRPASQYMMSLDDPKLGRTIAFEYVTRELPVIA